MKTDHWFYGLFQSAPDLITLLLPVVGASASPVGSALGPDAPAAGQAAINNVAAVTPFSCGGGLIQTTSG